MQPEWNKIEPPQELGDLGKGLQAYLEGIKSQLEEESAKVRHVLDLLLVELQKQQDISK
jgi:hypothetical protein